MARGQEEPKDQYRYGEESIKRTKESVKQLHSEFKALGQTLVSAINNAVNSMDPLKTTA